MTWTPGCQLWDGSPAVQFYWHQRRRHLAWEQKKKKRRWRTSGPLHLSCFMWFRTWVGMQRGFSSCLPPPALPPLKAGWCSHWLTIPGKEPKIQLWNLLWCWLYAGEKLSESKWYFIINRWHATVLHATYLTTTEKKCIIHFTKWI